MARRVESPKDLPWARHAIIETYCGPVGDDGADQLAARSGIDAQVLRDQNRRVAASLEGADLYWVTPDMTRLALTASEDLPEWSAGVAAPSTTGLLVWRAPLPEITWRHPLPDVRQPATVPLAGITWSRLEGIVMIQLLAPMEAIRSRSAGYRNDYLPLVPIDSLCTPILDPAVPWEREGRRLRRFPEGSAVLALIGATWITMQQENVASQTEVRVARRDIETSDRLGVSRPLVTTVRLRVRRASRPRDADRTTGRPLEERQLVHHHWKHQFYPSDRSHRLIYIDDYVRGPEGAPLRITERVLVWRR